MAVRDFGFFRVSTPTNNYDRSVSFLILSAMLGMGHRHRVQPCLLFVFSLLAALLLPFTVTRPVTIQEISDEVVIPDLFDILPSLGCYLHDQSGHEKVEVYSGDMDERWHVQVLWSQSISNTRPPDSQPNRVVEGPDNE